jgi:hypothetical protein
VAAAILTLVIALLSGSVVWLIVGPRLPLAADSQQNELLNLVAYTGLALPLAFALVFFLLELL